MSAITPSVTRPATIVLDSVCFQWQLATGIARVWRSLLEEWSGTAFGKSLVVLDRCGTAPEFDGIGYVPFKKYDEHSATCESFILEDVCRQAIAGKAKATLNPELSKLWRSIRTYQLRPDANLEGLQELESLWLKALREPPGVVVDRGKRIKESSR